MGGALDGVRVLAMALLANVGSNYLCLGDVPGRWGNAHASIVPYQAFQAADDYLDLATGNDGQWQRFCKVTAVTEWAVDARFARNPQRVAHRRRHHRHGHPPLKKSTLTSTFRAIWVFGRLHNAHPSPSRPPCSTNYVAIMWCPTGPGALLSAAPDSAAVPRAQQ